MQNIVWTYITEEIYRKHSDWGSKQLLEIRILV